MRQHFRNTINFENGVHSDKTLGTGNIEHHSNVMKPEESLYKI